MFELVLAIKELSSFVKNFSDDVDGASVVVQEFGGTGTSMNHLRIHIIPRRGSEGRTNANVEDDLQDFAQKFMQTLRDQEEGLDEKLKKEADKYRTAIEAK